MGRILNRQLTGVVLVGAAVLSVFMAAGCCENCRLNLAGRKKPFPEGYGAGACVLGPCWL